MSQSTLPSFLEVSPGKVPSREFQDRGFHPKAESSGFDGFEVSLSERDAKPGNPRLRAPKDESISNLQPHVRGRKTRRAHSNGLSRSVPWFNEDLCILSTLPGARHAKSPKIGNLKPPLDSRISASCTAPRVPICGSHACVRKTSRQPQHSEIQCQEPRTDSRLNSLSGRWCTPSKRKGRAHLPTRICDHLPQRPLQS